jgi:dTMP kinase
MRRALCLGSGVFEGIDILAYLLYHFGMNWQKLKGKFIVIDGPDGSGKSTQLELLAKVMIDNNVPVLSLRDPGGTQIGERIRGILLDNGNVDMCVRCELLLYMASRAQLFTQRIAPALSRCECVLCDRWVSSTYAYQAVAGKIGPDMVLKVAETALERTWPDLTIIIDLPSNLGLNRISGPPDRMEQKGNEYHRQVRKAFLELADVRDDFEVVDGSDSVQKVHQKICEVIERYVNS